MVRNIIVNNKVFPTQGEERYVAIYYRYGMGYGESYETLSYAVNCIKSGDEEGDMSSWGVWDTELETLVVINDFQRRLWEVYPNAVDYDTFGDELEYFDAIDVEGTVIEVEYLELPAGQR